MLRWAKIIVTTVYFLSVAFIVFFEGARSFRWMPYTLNDVDWIPFVNKWHFITGPDYLVSGNAFFIWREIIGNICLMIPMPISFRLLNRNFKFIDTFLLTIIVSFGIEITQFFTGMGHADADDLILNSFGGFIGYILLILAPIHEN